MPKSKSLFKFAKHLQVCRLTNCHQSKAQPIPNHDDQEQVEVLAPYGTEKRQPHGQYNQSNQQVLVYSAHQLSTNQTAGKYSSISATEKIGVVNL